MLLELTEEVCRRLRNMGKACKTVSVGVRDGDLISGFSRQATMGVHTNATRPVLEEDALQEMSRVLAEAIQTDSLVTLTVYDPFENRQIPMYPKRIDPISRKLKGLSPDGDNTISVALHDILNIEPN